MFWWILGGVCLFLAITAFVIYLISENWSMPDWLDICFGLWSAICFSVALVVFIVCPIIKVTYDKKISVFIQQKYYIEEVAPNFPETDNYALTMKKIELNQWLYEAQFKVKHYKVFTLYSDEVLKLEEIK